MSIKADPRAAQEYNRLRNEFPIRPLVDSCFKSEQTLTLTLLNSRSLVKHCYDISSDATLIDSDVLAITETHLLPDQSTTCIVNALHQFEINDDSNLDKYQSLVNVNVLY